MAGALLSTQASLLNTNSETLRGGMSCLCQQFAEVAMADYSVQAIKRQNLKKYQQKQIKTRKKTNKKENLNLNQAVFNIATTSTKLAMSN